MNFTDYSGPGRPFRGSTDWAAAQIERLLEGGAPPAHGPGGRAIVLRTPEQWAPNFPVRTRPEVVFVNGTDWTLRGAALGGAAGAFGGGLLGAIGGGAACTPAAPGVGTLACGVGGAMEGAAIGGGLGATAGAAIGAGIDALTSDEEEDEEQEAFCRERYAVETEMCKAIARARGKRKAALCYGSAAARYAACLRGLPVPPLITWNN